MGFASFRMGVSHFALFPMLVDSPGIDFLFSCSDTSVLGGILVWWSFGWVLGLPLVLLCNLEQQSLFNICLYQKVRDGLHLIRETIGVGTKYFELKTGQHNRFFHGSTTPS